MSMPVTPVPQGRPRLTTIGGQARAFTPPKTRAFVREVQQLWYIAGRPVVPEGVYFAATITATFARPASHLCRSGLTSVGRKSLFPRPDCDNLAKSVLDALQGHAFDDDLLVRRLVVDKQWGDTGSVVFAAEW